jgi:parallel beta-helix repeat protein
VRGNLVSGGDHGILLDQSSDSVIRDNTIVQTTIGVELVLNSSIGVDSYNNNLLQNGVQASDQRGLENVWDGGYLIGGNFWSDYAGPDDCSGASQNVCPDSDGIGDVPYRIDADSGDRYPLMSPAVGDLPPVAVASTPKLRGSPREVFPFTSTLSTDDFGIASFRWGSDEGHSSDAATAEFALSVVGTHNVTLTVTDTSGQTDMDTIQVEVREPAPGHIRGWVVDQSGQAVVGALVILERNGTGVKSNRSAVGGSFEFTNLTPGAYFVSVEADGFLRARAPVNVAPGNVSEVTMRLSPDNSRLYLVAGGVAVVAAIAVLGYGIARWRRRKVAK